MDTVDVILNQKIITVRKNKIEIVVSFNIGGELDMTQCPKVPARNFTVELLVQLVGVERGTPCLVKLFEVPALVLRHQLLECEVMQDFDVCTVRLLIRLPL